jgi:hypothetical protein
LVLPLMAGAMHCCFVRFDIALHRMQRTFPPSVKRYWSITSYSEVAFSLIAAFRLRPNNKFLFGTGPHERLMHM